jgi:hypothetical protein
MILVGVMALLPLVAGAQVLRVDGSSDEAADKSFGDMVNSENPEQRRKLLTALVQINMEGVKNVGQAEASEASHHPSAARVRKKIDGMTAEQIIALGAQAQGTSPGLHVVIRDQSDASLARIDGSSDTAANASFKAMVDSTPADKRQPLVVALLQINMQGVKSARDANFDVSAAHVRTKIDGMTADDIIALGKTIAADSGAAKVVAGNSGAPDPGVPSDLLRPLPAGAAHDDLKGTTWDFEQRANGTVEKFSYRLDADGTATMVESDVKPNGAARWEASGNEFLLSVNDGYAVMRGTFDTNDSLHGDGANRAAFRYTWTASKR